jgi:hypothetical protein
MKCQYCDNPGDLWTLWCGHEAGQVYLCDDHAQPLRTMLDSADPIPLPTKERAVFKVTPLKTTKRTRAFKKR